MNRTAVRAGIIIVALAALSFTSIARGAAGDLYVAGSDSGTIYRISPNGAKHVFASGLDQPTSLAFDRAGNLFVGETGSSARVITKFTPAGGKTTFATGVYAYSLCFDQAGTLFVGDALSNSILTYTPEGTKQVFASGLNAPFDIAFDKNGNLFAADGDTGIVYRFTPAGNRTTFASGLENPQALAFDFGGNLLVSDFAAGSIYRFTPAGTRSTLHTASFPGDLAFDTTGNLFVSSATLNNIAVYSVTGDRTVFADDLSRPLGIAFEPARGFPLNISTRANVQTGDKQVIAGFIIRGGSAQRVLLRGIGPSLPLAGALADPVLALRNSAGAFLNGNDNWKDTQEEAIAATKIPPSHNKEAALLINLGSDAAYTAILSGSGASSGIGLVEVYDLDAGSTNSELANISTRAFVGTGNDVVIGGFIVGVNGAKVLIRGLGPSLAKEGVPNPVADPNLKLHNGNGVLVAANDNWKDKQRAAIQATGIPPTNNAEAAIVETLRAGNYTAILAGQGGTGIGLVEIYNLD